MKKCLVTGATGFIGRSLCQHLRRHGVWVRAVVRRPADGPWDEFAVADLSRGGSAVDVLGDVDSVFHLAGRAHAVADRPGDDTEYERINVNGTQTLLAALSEHKVARIVFFSSVKTMGEGGDACVDERCSIPPETAYGSTKLAAERLVQEAGKRYGMHVCNLRLPLVYGPGVKGNLLRMIDAIERGRFPPLPEMGNKRSMVHVDDVVQAALLAATSPRANGQTYIVTDDQTYSTRYIQESIYRALGKRVPSWSVPIFVLRAMAKVGDLISFVTKRRFVFDSGTLEKLLGSSWYSAEKIKRELGYGPKRVFDDAVEEMVAHYKGQRA